MKDLNKITFTARKGDMKKLIQNFLALAFTNFEENGKKKLLETGRKHLREQTRDGFNQFRGIYRRNRRISPTLESSIRIDRRTPILGEQQSKYNLSSRRTNTNG